MERYELNRMFEQLSPTPEQERTMLDSLLEERKEKPVKHVRRFVVLIAAAALMLLTCAAAVVMQVDQRFLEYFGLETEQEVLLSRSAVPLDVSVTDNGCTLEAKQVLTDRYSLMMVVDFTAPEGTVLEGEAFMMEPYGMGFSMEGQEPNTRSAKLELLEDDDPLDNHISLLFTMELGSEYRYLMGTNITFAPKSLSSYNGWVWTEVCTGDWSFSIQLPDRDTGRVCLEGETLYVEGEPFRLTSFYLSPINVGYDIEGNFDVFRMTPGIWDHTKQNIILTTASGESIAIVDTTMGELSHITWKGRILFKPERILDPEEIVSVTIYGQTFDLK